MKALISFFIQYILDSISKRSNSLRKQINKRSLDINIADMNHDYEYASKLFEVNRTQINQLGFLNKFRRVLNELLKMQNKGSKVPKLAYLLLSFAIFCKNYDDSILGDMNEQFCIDSEEYGIFFARCKYWWQVFRSAPRMVLQKLAKELIRKFK